MELATTRESGDKIMAINGVFPAAVGEKVEVEIAGVKELEATVPAGKSWSVNVSIQVIESDV
jgi:hypothetical protein